MNSRYSDPDFADPDARDFPNDHVPRKTSLRKCQARLNQYHGLAFERYCCRKLNLDGFKTTKVREYDGFTHGVDLVIRETAWGLVPVQCKRTTDIWYGLTGLKELRENCSFEKYPLGACFISLYRPPATTAVVKVFVTRVPNIANGWEVFSYSEFISLLADRARALTAGVKTGTIQGDEPPLRRNPAGPIPEDPGDGDFSVT